jgi:hypothetical protein
MKAKSAEKAALKNKTSILVVKSDIKSGPPIKVVPL